MKLKYLRGKFETKWIMRIAEKKKQNMEKEEKIDREENRKEEKEMPKISAFVFSSIKVNGLLHRIRNIDKRRRDVWFKL